MEWGGLANVNGHGRKGDAIANRPYFLYPKTDTFERKQKLVGYF